MSLIFFLSSQSRLPIPAPRIPYGDKLCHCLEFAVLGYLLMRALIHGGYSRIPQNASLLLAIVIAVLFGLTDEIHQVFVPLRQSDMFDLLADGLGATLGAWGALLINWFIIRRQENMRRQGKDHQ
ncbi:MAG: VanZ family protein [bacterium]